MVKFLIFNILIITSISCRLGKNKSTQAETEYYNFNQDQFTFVVFDKAGVDAFMNKYEPLAAGNDTINKDIKNILTKLRFETSAHNAFTGKYDYSLNTNEPDSSSFNLAQKVIGATLNTENREHFQASLSYLFFYKCLPNRFKYKWHQTTTGHFEFNATFFALLRDNSKELDEIIYGERGYWDKKLQPIFSGETIYNEITKMDAKAMKMTIETNAAFSDTRFNADKEKFTAFLDEVISDNWRMILIDWN